MDTDGIIQILAELAQSENLQVESWDNCRGYPQMADSDLVYYTGYPQMADSDLGYYTGYPQMADSDLGNKASSGTSTTAPSERSATEHPVGQGCDLREFLSHSLERNMASSDTSKTGPTGRSDSECRIGHFRYNSPLKRFRPAWASNPRLRDRLIDQEGYVECNMESWSTGPTGRSASERPIAQAGDEMHDKYKNEFMSHSLKRNMVSSDTSTTGSTARSTSELPVAQGGDERGTLWRAVSGFGRHLISRTWQHVTSKYAASVKVQLLPVHAILQTLHGPHRERLANRMREIMNEYSVVDLDTLTDNIMQDSSLVRKIIIKYLVEYLTEEMSLPVRLPTRDDSIQHTET